VSRKSRKPAGSKPAQASDKQVGKQNQSQPKPETESSLSPPPPSELRAELAAAVPGVTERETHLVLELLAARPGVRSAPAVLKAEIRNGTATGLVDEIRRGATSGLEPASGRHHRRPPHCGDRECNQQTRRREDPETAEDLGPCPKCSGTEDRRLA
jgi:hypothetical protein